jgi:DNA-binding beta-propeller fold protein YncE
LSLVLGACGDNTPTSAPTSTIAATTAVPTTAIPTTIAATTAVSTTSPAKTAATANNSPVEFVRKIDISANVKVPTGMVLDKQGNFYVTDARLNTINKFDSNGKLLLQWGKQGSGDGEFNLSRSKPPLQYAGYIAIDPSGNIYVPDTYNHRIQKFDGNGKFLTKWGNEGAGDGQFHEPAQIVLDSQNNLYVSDLSVKDVTGRIQKFDPNGKFLGSYRNEGSGDGQFMVGWASALDKQDNLYVTDVMNFRLQVFDSNWKFLRKMGGLGDGDGQFHEPTCLAVDSKGNIYAGDSNPEVGSRIQIFSPTGKFLGQWGSPGGEAPFGFMAALQIYSNDNIYLTRGPDSGAIYQFRLKP